MKKFYMVFIPVLIAASLLASGYVSPGVTQVGWQIWRESDHQHDCDVIGTDVDTPFGEMSSAGVIALPTPSGIDSPANTLQVIICGDGVADDTYKVRVFAYKPDGPAMSVCLITGSLGAEPVVNFPITGAAASATWLWDDTLTVTTDSFPGTIATTTVADKLAMTEIPTNGFKYFYCQIEDCNGPGEASEPNNITIYYSYK